jgi:hypothetical protein
LWWNSRYFKWFPDISSFPSSFVSLDIGSP